MGYGGVIKKVVRVAVPMVATYFGGPLAGAIASAAVTGATGGSFKESLMAGATSYIGSYVGQQISGSVNAGDLGSQISSGAADFTAATAAAPARVFSAGIGDSVTLATGAAAEAAIAASGTIGSSFSGALSQLASGANTGLSNTFSQFAPSGVDFGFGGLTEAAGTIFKTPLDIIRSIGGEVLQPSTLLGSAVGGYTTFTLNQALLANTLEADQLLEEQGYTPEQIKLLKDAARSELSQTAFDRITGETINPGISEEEFKKIIASGIERENVALGPATRQQFDNVFNTPNLGQMFLDEETDLRKGTFNQAIGQAFPGSPFGDIDQGIIDSIVQERSGPARQEIANFGARGNLNPTGGQTANSILDEQTIGAANRVNQVGEQVLGQNRNDIGAIRDRARSTVSGYKLGDDLFNVTPFADERSSLIDARNTSFQGDVTSALGSEPLFNISSALSGAGRAQGVVSGAPSNQSFLDVLAARSSGVSSGRNKRGIGVAGSGAF